MENWNNALFGVFDASSDAVAVVRLGSIIYLNTPARKLFGEDALHRPAADYFSALMLESEESPVAGNVTVGEWSLPVTSVRVDDLRVLTVYPDQGPFAPNDTALLGSVGAALKNQLAVCATGLGLLNGRVRESSDIRSVRYTAMVDKAFHSMERIVSHCGSFLGDGDWTLHESTVDIPMLVSELVSTVAYLTEDKGVTLTWSSDCRELTYYGDGAKLERMLLHLLSNSLKYTPRGGKITVSVKSAPGGVRLSVRDNGRGIRPEVFNTVFSRYRAERDLSDADAGAGLGLPLVQRIAVLHGGHAILESKPDVGTTVTVFLPFREPPEEVLRSTGVEYKNPLAVFLTELADVLAYTAYIREE